MQNANAICIKLICSHKAATANNNNKKKGEKKKKQNQTLHATNIIATNWMQWKIEARNCMWYYYAWILIALCVCCISIQDI